MKKRRVQKLSFQVFAEAKRIRWEKNDMRVFLQLRNRLLFANLINGKKYKVLTLYSFREFVYRDAHREPKESLRTVEPFTYSLLSLEKGKATKSSLNLKSWS